MATGEESYSSDAGQPLSPAARLFHSPRLNCYIMGIMGCKTSVNPDLVKQGLQHTLLNHPRFSSKLVEEGNIWRRKKWVRTKVNIDNHVIVPNISKDIENPDRFVDDYISNITTTPLDLSKPLWELHLLDIKTKDAESTGIFRIHHSMGDGASLMSLLLACTRKTYNPEEVPSVLEKNREGSSYSGGFGLWLLLTIWSVLRLVWNTFVDLILFVATMIFLKDTKTPIKGEPGAELVTKRFVIRTFNLEHIKQVKNAMNMTFNDVLLGITQAGLSKYLSRRYGESNIDEGAEPKIPKNTRLRAMILVNLRPTIGIQALADMMAKGSKTRWGNRMGYILLPFNIGLQDNPLDYVFQAKATIDRKKRSLEAMCTFACAQLVLIALGIKVAAAITYRVFCHSTMAFSNMIGPREEISFYGHPISYIAPSVYGHAHALTMHFQSYCNKMTVVLAVDPNVIPDPHRLCDDLEESLKIIREAVIKRGLIKDIV